MHHRLRLYTGDDEFATTAEPKTSIKLADLIRVISDASRFKRSWLNDFENDDVEIPTDLYDVISTYWEVRPGA
jgi:hypothetical protein